MRFNWKEKNFFMGNPNPPGRIIHYQKGPTYDIRVGVYPHSVLSGRKGRVLYLEFERKGGVAL